MDSSIHVSFAQTPKCGRPPVVGRPTTRRFSPDEGRAVVPFKRGVYEQGDCAPIGLATKSCAGRVRRPPASPRARLFRIARGERLDAKDVLNRLAVPTITEIHRGVRALHAARPKDPDARTLRAPNALIQNAVLSGLVRPRAERETCRVGVRREDGPACLRRRGENVHEVAFNARFDHAIFREQRLETAVKN